MLKHYAAGFALTAFAVFAFPYGGTAAWPVFVYAAIFVSGMACILTSPKDSDER